MKRMLVLLMLATAGSMVKAQDIVKWTYSAKKINDKTYELHFMANMDQPWKIYSQNTPEGGPVATKISIKKNTMVTLVGKAKEIGKMEEKYEDAFGVKVLFYHDKVDFVQLVKLKAPVKTTVTGSVLFMSCNETQCMPPAESTFTIGLK